MTPMRNRVVLRNAAASRTTVRRSTAAVRQTLPLVSAWLSKMSFQAREGGVFRYRQRKSVWSKDHALKLDKVAVVCL